MNASPHPAQYAHVHTQDELIHPYGTLSFLSPLFLHVLSPLFSLQNHLFRLIYHKQRNRLRQTRQHPYNPRISNGVNTAFHKLQTHTKHTLNFMHCEDSFFFFFFSFFFFLNPPNQTHMRAHSHGYLWPLSVECCHLCGTERAQLSPLTARCMQLNRIKVISPTEVIASRWLPHRNMLLMKLLIHRGCMLVWQSERKLTHVCAVCLDVLPFGCNTRGST